MFLISGSRFILFIFFWPFQTHKRVNVVGNSRINAKAKDIQIQPNRFYKASALMWSFPVSELWTTLSIVVDDKKKN